MHGLPRGSLFAAIVAGGALLALPALAQMGPGPGPGPGPGMMHGYGPGGWHMWNGPGWWGGSDAMDTRINGRLAFLKAELKITDAQSKAWDKLAEAVRSSSKQMADRMKTQFSSDRQNATLPERLDAQEAFMTARLAEIKQVKTALTELYAVLSPEQKKEADTLVLPMTGMGMMGGGWGMMGNGWGMRPGPWPR